MKEREVHDCMFAGRESIDADDWGLISCPFKMLSPVLSKGTDRVRGLGGKPSHTLGRGKSDCAVNWGREQQQVYGPLSGLLKNVIGALSVLWSNANKLITDIFHLV